MRRITLWLLSTVAALVLLFSYRTSVGSSGGTTAAPVIADAAAGKTYDGSVAQTRWGPVQVRITVDGGRITDVVAVQYPDNNRRDQQINDYALPQLRTEVLQAQGADIDAVSGATVTSDGYKESLQAALDAAHID
ncbi:FMN-binding protein [Dactylosporangium sp. CA-092794]|uniref:FMN-binding protein n=1 Tax=Dactylosporangium sp. CA-092794 TaxID=3239929 RepID=UPI003D9064AB